MKAALIPSKGYEEQALLSHIHLMLPLSETLANHDYLQTYKDARKRGDYVILDNGCAEGQTVSGETLLEVANLIGVHEIVAPDVMGDASGTAEATSQFLRKHEGAADFNVMGVLQGETARDRKFLLSVFAGFDAITTIGIPKVLVTSSGDDTRLKVARSIQDRYPNRFKIHLLGLSSHFPNEVVQIKFPGVRSVDSALPFKTAENDITLTMRTPHVPRRHDYFKVKYQTDMHVLMHNINQFKYWAERSES